MHDSGLHRLKAGWLECAHCRALRKAALFAGSWCIPGVKASAGAEAGSIKVRGDEAPELAKDCAAVLGGATTAERC